jgi:hypothetical protein
VEPDELRDERFKINCVTVANPFRPHVSRCQLRAKACIAASQHTASPSMMQERDRKRASASTFYPCELRFLMLMVFTSSAASGDVGEGPLAPAVSTREQRSLAMPIHRLLEKHAFGPDEIRVLTSAFDEALRKLGLADRADPVVEVVARKIIELAQQGERDPTRLSERAIQALSR